MSNTFAAEPQGMRGWPEKQKDGRTEMAQFHGTPGADDLDGTGLNDEIYAFGGDDIGAGLGGDDVIVVGAGADAIEGGGGHDWLDGGAGSDRMVGGLGDDVFIVDDAGDLVIEESHGGLDTVLASISYRLGWGLNQLILTGTAAIDATGNSQRNLIIGNDAANIIDGAGGRDRMLGGGGDDTYIVDQAGDRVVEEAGGGSDTVRSSVSFTLGGAVENLVLTGRAAIDGTGNSQRNEITGNSAANRLDGGAGADVMRGGKGNDTYIVDNLLDRVRESEGGGFDVVISSASFSLLGNYIEKLVLIGTARHGSGGANADIIIGSGVSNRLFGGPGDDLIEGGDGDDEIHGHSGRDRLSGGSGSDGFYFELWPFAVDADALPDFSPADDTIFLYFNAFPGIPYLGNLGAGAFRIGPRAADSTDRIIYHPGSGNIFYDGDGDGTGFEAVLLATVEAGTPLTRFDFVIWG